MVKKLKDLKKLKGLKTNEKIKEIILILCKRHIYIYIYQKMNLFDSFFDRYKDKKSLQAEIFYLIRLKKRLKTIK